VSLITTMHTFILYIHNTSQLLIYHWQRTSASTILLFNVIVIYSGSVW